MKRYDKAYFDRWYRSSSAVVTAEWRRYRVRLALAAAEFVLERPVRSVLDIGCGEGAWRAELRRLRPDVRYQGIDSSEYVVRRFGRRRNILPGTFGDIARLNLRRTFDLIVCADMLEYVPAAEMRRGLRAIPSLLRGVAYIEAYTDPTQFEGDRDGWHHRSEREYRTAFARAGLHALGMNCWVTWDRWRRLNPLERCPRPVRPG